MPDSIIIYSNSNFPYGLAESQKIGLIAKSLQLAGYSTYVINRLGSLSDNYNINYVGRTERTIYFYSSKKVYNEKSIFKRKYLKLLGIFTEVKLISKIKPRYIFISSKKSFDIIFYKITSFFICGAKIVLIFHELPKAVQSKSIFSKFNNYIYDHLIFRIIDSYLPISEYLCAYVKSKNNKLPFMKLPVLVDSEYFDSIAITSPSKKYFLYSGAAGYYEVIDFIINSFELLNNEAICLYLVVNGNDAQISKIENRISEVREPSKYLIFCNLEYSDLAKKLKESLALLIPLRDNIRDTSRFPHKVGEYLASSRPVITTKFGEPSRYLEDGKTALISDNFSPDSFAEKMYWVIQNEKEAGQIGLRGRKVAEIYFDYRSYSEKFKSLLQSL